MVNYQIFISYRRNPDYTIAKALYEELNTLGFLVFWDKKSIQTGASFPAEIEAAIINTEVFVLLLSKNSLSQRDANDWVWQEILKAHKHHRIIIPVFDKECTGLEDCFSGSYENNDIYSIIAKRQFAECKFDRDDVVNSIHQIVNELKLLLISRGIFPENDITLKRKETHDDYSDICQNLISLIDTCAACPRKSCPFVSESPQRDEELLELLQSHKKAEWFEEIEADDRKKALILSSEEEAVNFFSDPYYHTCPPDIRSYLDQEGNAYYYVAYTPGGGEIAEFLDRIKDDYIKSIGGEDNWISFDCPCKKQTDKIKSLERKLKVFNKGALQEDVLDLTCKIYEIEKKYKSSRKKSSKTLYKFFVREYLEYCKQQINRLWAEKKDYYFCLSRLNHQFSTIYDGVKRLNQLYPDDINNNGARVLIYDLWMLLRKSSRILTVAEEKIRCNVADYRTALLTEIDSFCALYHAIESNDSEREIEWSWETIDIPEEDFIHHSDQFGRSLLFPDLHEPNGKSYISERERIQNIRREAFWWEDIQPIKRNPHILKYYAKRLSPAPYEEQRRKNRETITAYHLLFPLYQCLLDLKDFILNDKEDYSQYLLPRYKVITYGGELNDSRSYPKASMSSGVNCQSKIAVSYLSRTGNHSIATLLLKISNPDMNSLQWLIKRATNEDNIIYQICLAQNYEILGQYQQAYRWYEYLFHKLKDNIEYDTKSIALRYFVCAVEIKNDDVIKSNIAGDLGPLALIIIRGMDAWFDFPNNYDVNNEIHNLYSALMNVLELPQNPIGPSSMDNFPILEGVYSHMKSDSFMNEALSGLCDLAEKGDAQSLGILSYYHWLYRHDMQKAKSLFNQAIQRALGKGFPYISKISPTLGHYCNTEP